MKPQQGINFTYICFNPHEHTKENILQQQSNQYIKYKYLTAGLDIFMSYLLPKKKLQFFESVGFIGTKNVNKQGVAVVIICELSRS